MLTLTVSSIIGVIASVWLAMLAIGERTIDLTTVAALNISYHAIACRDDISCRTVVLHAKFYIRLISYQLISPAGRHGAALK
jgi:hypothetical protein